LAKFNGANLSGSDLRGATDAVFGSAITRNAILPDGMINGLSLTAGELLVVRNSNVAIHVVGTPTLDPDTTIQMLFDGNSWESTISFDPDISLTLSGNLVLSVASGVDWNSLENQSAQLFDWTGVSLSGLLNIVGDPRWDTSRLYTTGFVSFCSSESGVGMTGAEELFAVPEPPPIVLLTIGVASLLACAWRASPTPHAHAR